jgi:hypothetical protein
MAITTAARLTNQQIADYQARGFIHIPNIISKAEADHYRQAALATAARLQDRNTQQEKKVFSQHVNVWLHD